MILTATCCCLSSYAPPLPQTAENSRCRKFRSKSIHNYEQPSTTTSRAPPSPGLSFHQQRNLVHQHHTATLQVSVQNLETSCCSTSTDLSSGKNLTLGVAIKSVSLKLGSRGGLLSHLLLLHSFAANWPIVTALIG